MELLWSIHETDRSLQSGVEVWNDWRLISTPSGSMTCLLGTEAILPLLLSLVYNVTYALYG